jgi:hypothetical protein
MEETQSLTSWRAILVECKILGAVTTLVEGQRPDEALINQAEGNNLTSENVNKSPFELRRHNL